jgi:2-polyprenyl-3-methyl-5-hydroxy-6-metoxy-1,4-benzoquinol methylase
MKQRLRALAKRLLRPAWRRIRTRIVTSVIEELDSRVGRVQTASQIELLHATIRELRETLDARLSAQIDATTALMLGELAKLERLSAGVETSLRQAITEREERADARFDDVQIRLAANTGISDVGKLAARVENLIERFRARPYMDHDVFAQRNGEVPAGPAGFDYLGFEDIFRGSEELIQARQRVYLQFFRAGERVLDVGCGRGEFLSVLDEARVHGLGVDTNATMIEHCLARGLTTVERIDANTFLDRNGDPLDGVFSAQVIEHLQFEDLTRFLALACRRLRSGGVFVAETVNPHSIEAMKTFYVDLTHVKPLFPETMLFLARNAGFAKAKIFYPNGSGFGETADWTQHEYALVAWKHPDA